MTNGDIVFVVTRGDYSNYRILGVFADRKKAECFAELHLHRGDTADIEEYVLDAMPDHPQGLLPWWVLIDRDGNCDVHRESIELMVDDMRPLDNGVQMLCSVWALDEQHAAKIANERRVQMIADGSWNTRLHEVI